MASPLGNGDAAAEIPAVLLVDDDARNLLALESLLEHDEFRLVKAQTSDAALLALMNGEFAAIVLDVQMPEVNGIELARLIKQRKRTQHIPIIFLTAHYREEEHAVLAYDVGAVDYLTKPINPAVLRSKVHVFVDLFRKTRALEAQNILLQREAEERSRRIAAETARAEAEAANAAKDRFLAMLSHELRTPLTPIVYAVSMLERDADCPPHIREALATIRRNVWLEARLIDDLLDLARIRNGKLSLKMQEVDVHETLRETIKICLGDMRKKRVQLTEHFAARKTVVQADPARLQQIFWNLLANATKFTPEGGAITVRTNVPSGSSCIEVEVRDTGIGIEPTQLSRIFDAFEQGSRSTSAGLGLGLAIGKALVDLHGGTIRAFSDGAGAGAAFVVSLPTVVATARAAEFTEPALERPNVRVLLVEDHVDTAVTMQMLLRHHGYEVRIAASIADALTAAASFPFDVLVSDIGLPDGRGTELLAKLQAGADGPVLAIAMSGYGMEDDLERSRRAGFAEHLTKPVDFDSLHQAIARLARAIASPASP